MRHYVVTLALVGLSLRAAERPLEFNRDVRPILSDKCNSCHGPDAIAKKIPLRLDIEEWAKRDLGKGRHAIVEGKPDESLLIRRITADNKTMRMPPVYTGLNLTEKDIATLRTWIAQGAQWQKHWSFIPPVRHPLPAVQNTAWAKNPIDRFVLERLEREGLAPAPAASREKLLRRAALDLTGLPPSPDEMEAFLKDQSKDAYEKAVDRMLSSPRYGERMAERWLDAARYADSNGYQFDGERVMWRWRDWVIDAFNRNQPYDRFVLEQIAGDMLPGATLEQKMATGFNRNHRGNTEDGIVPEEYAVEYVVDRVETTSTVFLGLTLGCTRCHNHKYDPFTQKEFYQLFAYFNNVPENGRAMKYGNSPPVVAAPTREQQQAHEVLNRKIREGEETLARYSRSAGSARTAWERGLAGEAPVYWAPSAALDSSLALDDAGRAKPHGTVTFAEGKIGGAAALDGTAYLEVAGAAAFDIEDRFSLAAWARPEGTPDGPIVTRMSDSSNGKGFGIHFDKGKVHVHVTSSYPTDHIQMVSEQTFAAGEWHHLGMTYDGSRLAAGVQVFVDGKPLKMNVLAETLYRPFGNAGKGFSEPLRIGGGWGAKRRFHGKIDDVRVYSRVLDSTEMSALALGESLNEIARKAPAQRTETERMVLERQFLETAAPAEIRETWQRMAVLKQEREKLERTFPTVMVMAESPVPKETHLLIRGAYDKPGDKVEPGLPAVLPPLPAGAPNNRLGFGRWLIDPSNPLTARVAVNRFWQMYFGTGIVKTVEDFGSQGEWPSHPELLDWLATEFTRTGWDVKALQKLIVTSATYRQSSRATPELIQRDPENRLLARGPRYRLPAEMIRDQALYAAGLLKEKLGGPSVKPYQPAGLWKELAMQDMDYVQARGADLYRRGLYTFWKRTIAPPMMVNFDAANREACVVRETRTNTPLQALNLMNDVTFLEAARFVGQRMIKEGGSDATARLRYGFRLLTGRAPSAGEEQVLRDNLNYHLDYFSGNPEKVKGFLTYGEAAADTGVPQRDLAAYTSVASLLLNLDEVVTKQ